MRVRRYAPRKLLVASIGVATMSYVAASCGGSTTNPPGHPVTDAAKDAIEEFPVANLAVAPDQNVPHDASHDTIDEFPVANLVVAPDSGDG